MVADDADPPGPVDDEAEPPLMAPLPDVAPAAVSLGGDIPPAPVPPGLIPPGFELALEAEPGAPGVVAVEDDDVEPGAPGVVVVEEDDDDGGAPPGTTVVLSLRSHAESASAPTSSNK